MDAGVKQARTFEHAGVGTDVQAWRQQV